MFLYFVERLIFESQRVTESKPTRIESDRIMIGGQVTGITGLLELQTAITTEPLTVPAGTFDNVLRSTVKGRGATLAEENVEVGSYFALGVGPIKKVWKDHRGSVTCTLELVKYQVEK